VGSSRQIAWRFNEKRVGMLWNREAKGAGPPELASLARAVLAAHEQQFHLGFGRTVTSEKSYRIC
jgi:hypothetical protein